MLCIVPTCTQQTGTFLEQVACPQGMVLQTGWTLSALTDFLSRQDLQLLHSSIQSNTTIQFLWTWRTFILQVQRKHEKACKNTSQDSQPERANRHARQTKAPSRHDVTLASPSFTTTQAGILWSRSCHPESKMLYRDGMNLKKGRRMKTCNKSSHSSRTGQDMPIITYIL